MRNTKNAFTLVELIVVITILAILGTIAFISLQGYSADARNAKRISDLWNIQSAISLWKIEWVNLLSYIKTNSNNKMTNIALAWSGLVESDKYDAGTLSYSVLNIDEKDFKDPKGNNEYRIGATSLQNGTFQLTTLIEQEGTNSAQVNGTYIARSNTPISTASVDNYTNTSTVVVVNAAANRFKAGDYVQDWELTPNIAKVIKVSRDGITITVDNGTFVHWTIELIISESDGLIGASDDVANVITNNDTIDLPY